MTQSFVIVEVRGMNKDLQGDGRRFGAWPSCSGGKVSPSHKKSKWWGRIFFFVLVGMGKVRQRSGNCDPSE